MTTEIELRAMLREAMGELLPSLQAALMAEVDNRIAAIPHPKPLDQDAVARQAAAALLPQVTQQLNEAVRQIEGQVTAALSGLPTSAPVSPAQSATNGHYPVQPSAQPSAVTLSNTSAQPGRAVAADGVAHAVERIMATLNTFLDSGAPKLLGLYGQMQALKSPWMQDLNAAMLIKQQDPLRAAILGQQLLGPNAYEQVVPNAAMNGVMQGIRIGLTAKQGATQWPNSSPVPSAGSSAVPSSPNLPASVPTVPAGSVSMTSGPQKATLPKLKKSQLSEILGSLAMGRSEVR